MSKISDAVYRVLDANLNRLREALRVLEEYYRFINLQPQICEKLKPMRHSLIEMEKLLGKEALLSNRDTESDCFAETNRPEELCRESEKDILSANFKRAQEASRVIEEYSKLTGIKSVCDMAKKLRFSLYNMEKETMALKNA